MIIMIISKQNLILDVLKRSKGFPKGEVSTSGIISNILLSNKNDLLQKMLPKHNKILKIRSLLKY